MSETQPNIVLVTVDSLRADHCGYVDPESDLTPEIDRLAADGTAFRQAVAPGPRTPSSVPVTFTGEFLRPEADWSISDWRGRQQRIARHMARHSSVSETLQRQGYDTAAVTANPWTTRESNFDAGFDDFTEVSAASDDISSLSLSDSSLFRATDTVVSRLPADPGGWSEKKEWFAQWPGYYDHIRSRLDALEEPFFLWVFLLDSHQPYITPRRYREETSALEMYYAVARYWHGATSDEQLPDHAREVIQRSYRDAVRSVDSFVGRLRADVDPYDPAVVFHADHGEALGDHGNFGHPQALYEENLRVPFIVNDRDHSTAVDEQVTIKSLPSILGDLSAREFLPDEYTASTVLSQTEGGGKRAVRTPDWKYVAGDGDRRLHDLRGGAEETADVSDEFGDVVESLAPLVDRHDFTQTERSEIDTAAARVATATDRE